MPTSDDKDAFADTRMSFGEHLDELRSALFKAVLSIAIGFGVGLIVGYPVAQLIQTPLVEGMKELRMKQRLRQRAELGIESSGVADQMIDEGWAPEAQRVETQELAKLLESLGVSFQKQQLAAVPAVVPLTLWRDLDNDSSVRPIGTGVPDAFTVYIKTSLVVGIILSSPFVFYFLWSFVAAGLYPHERRYVHLFLPISIGLFLAGAALAFFVVFRFVLAFLFDFFDWMQIDPTPRISEWLGFVLLLPIGFGLSFQLPLVMLFLERISVFTVAQYFSYWRYAVLVIAVISMMLTPAEPYSMILMAIPLVFLYFGGALMCQLMPRPKGAFERAIP
ncbi:twin-arginine translocase subunit TatC [Botrimarina hoheduenensis]|uniref:Sec-independent protein translocase protein TatC n=1 Tax=Botrimarina hoheduenensis TaxID=2528000 RepID=A0A5C5VTX4_9BACT|nr:twin-arginine translocase subunit TatC [Botrimarina hoheduenensis]TWT41583.1 Sec-independent protein translocase protein TatCy [Botrimarina hoheduenensis]